MSLTNELTPLADSTLHDQLHGQYVPAGHVVHQIAANSCCRQVERSDMIRAISRDMMRTSSGGMLSPERLQEKQQKKREGENTLVEWSTCMFFVKSGCVVWREAQQLRFGNDKAIGQDDVQDTTHGLVAVRFDQGQCSAGATYHDNHRRREPITHSRGYHISSFQKGRHNYQALKSPQAHLFNTSILAHTHTHIYIYI